MQGIMDVNPERDFITMINKETLFGIFLVLTFWGCRNNDVTENIPTGPVNITIDLNLISYMHLNNVGTTEYFEGGAKGVLLIHDFDDNWYAFERTCAYQPLNACSKIWIDTQNIQLQCGTYSGNTFTECCQSHYSYSGYPVSGQAKGPLARYKVQRNANLLYIYN